MVFSNPSNLAVVSKLRAGKKTRPRRPGKEYALAARQRRLQQEYNNYHHPPSGDEIWICEFCEYESIFGSPPEALMRQYEIKDRRERRRLAEKRRLLEKAKMKGRKGKRATRTLLRTPLLLRISSRLRTSHATTNNQPIPCRCSIMVHRVRNTLQKTTTMILTV
jgi:hypothetical protein